LGRADRHGYQSLTKRGPGGQRHAILKLEGCTEIQGFLISLPRPFGEVAGILRYAGARGDRFDPRQAQRGA
jgi:hypothetical protein